MAEYLYYQTIVINYNKLLLKIDMEVGWFTIFKNLKGTFSKKMLGNTDLNEVK